MKLINDNWELSDKEFIKQMALTLTFSVNAKPDFRVRMYLRELEHKQKYGS